MTSILLVDGRNDFLHLAGEFFSRKGDIRVTAASSAAEALRMREKESFDAVLVNAGINEVSALKLAETAGSRYADVPLIVYGPVYDDTVSGVLRKRAEHVIDHEDDTSLLLFELLIVVKCLVKRKAIEKSLRRSEADFHSLVSKNFDAMVVVDAHGAVKYANPAAEDLFSLAEEDFVGKLFGFPIIMSEPVDMYILRKFRAFVAVEMRMVEVEWDGKPSYLISLRDITEHILYEEALRKSRDEMEARVKERTFELSESNELLQREIVERHRMELDLRESERKYRRLVEMAHEGIWSVDDRAMTTFTNPRMAEMLDYRPDDMNGKPLFYFTPEDMHGRIREILKRSRQGARHTLDVSLKKKDGSLIDTIVNVSPILKDGGKYGGVVLTVNDITQRKRDEAELKDAKAQAELYMDLMGHDINNMNQIGMGYVELALQSDDIEEIKAMLQRPLDVMRNTSQIIENVRKIRKMKTETAGVDVIDLCEVLSKVKAQYQDVYGREVTIRYEPKKDCLIKANGLIMDVFSNLVDNSIKHSDPSKPLTVDINVEAVKEKGRKYYYCSIQDNGQGIPGWVKDKIFMRFQRGDTKAHGKGLGLHIVKMLVDGFKGKIWVEDRIPGDHTQGAKFVVALPAAG